MDLLVSLLAKIFKKMRVTLQCSRFDSAFTHEIC